MKSSPRQPQAHWTIEVLLEACPGAVHILTRHGMACVGCAMARFETLAEAAREYRVELASLLGELRGAKGGEKHNEPRRRTGVERRGRGRTRGTRKVSEARS